MISNQFIAVAAVAAVMLAGADANGAKACCYRDTFNETNTAQACMPSTSNDCPDIAFWDLETSPALECLCGDSSSLWEGPASMAKGIIGALRGNAAVAAPTDDSTCCLFHDYGGSEALSKYNATWTSGTTCPEPVFGWKLEAKWASPQSICCFGELKAYAPAGWCKYPPTDDQTGEEEAPEWNGSPQPAY